MPGGKEPLCPASRRHGPCYLIRQSSLKELLASLLTAAGQEFGTLEQRFGRMYQEWGIIQPDSNCDYLTEAVLIASQSKGKLAIRKETCRGWPSTTM